MNQKIMPISTFANGDDMELQAWSENCCRGCLIQNDLEKSEEQNPSGVYFTNWQVAFQL